MGVASLLWSVLFSAVGLGYFLYGKKQTAVVPLVCGVALMIFPYFVSNLWLMLLIGAGLCAAPYFIRV